MCVTLCRSLVRAEKEIFTVAKIRAVVSGGIDFDFRYRKSIYKTRVCPQKCLPARGDVWWRNKGLSALNSVRDALFEVYCKFIDVHKFQIPKLRVGLYTVLILSSVLMSF